MPSGTSFQISGTASSNGTASVRISPDEWLPYTFTSGTWTLECAQANASRIMRASGVVKLSGLYYPSTNSPLPVSWATNLWIAIAGKISATDSTYTSTVSKASSAFSWGSHTGLYRAFDWLPSWIDVSGKPLAFPPSIHEHNSASITNPPWITANQVPAYDNTKIVSLDSNYCVRITGTNLVLLVNSGNVEAYTLTFGEDVLSGNLMPPPFSSGYTFPKDLVNYLTTVTVADWVISVAPEGFAGTQVSSDYPPSAWYDTLAPGMFPIYLPSQDGAYGTIMVSKTVGIFTNVVKMFSSAADLNRYCEISQLAIHTNLTLASGAHGGLPTSAQVGAASTNDFNQHATNSVIHVTSGDRSGWTTYPVISNIVSYVVGLHDALSSAHSELFAQKASITNEVTIVFTNVVVTGWIKLGDLYLKAGKSGDTNGLAVMQPGDANEYLFWVPTPPQ
jgi:hypothetical protein